VNPMSIQAVLVGGWVACNTSAFYGTFGLQGNTSVYFRQSLHCICHYFTSWSRSHPMQQLFCSEQPRLYGIKH
jgi:hypothetical protein